MATSDRMPDLHSAQRYLCKELLIVSVLLRCLWELSSPPGPTASHPISLQDRWERAWVRIKDQGPDQPLRHHADIGRGPLCLSSESSPTVPAFSGVSWNPVNSDPAITPQSPISRSPDMPLEIITRTTATRPSVFTTSEPFSGFSNLPRSSDVPVSPQW